MVESEHLSDDDLERYYLGMVTQERELARLEEHLLFCQSCLERTEATEDYVDVMRSACLSLPFFDVPCSYSQVFPQRRNGKQVKGQNK